jgi:hypothetical protein
MKADWQDMSTAPKDRKILLTDGDEVFEGEWDRRDFIRLQNENLAFAKGWMEMPDPLEIERCETCDTCGTDDNGKKCEACKGHGVIRADGKPWGFEADV